MDGKTAGYSVRFTVCAVLIFVVSCLQFSFKGITPKDIVNISLHGFYMEFGKPNFSLNLSWLCIAFSKLELSCVSVFQCGSATQPQCFAVQYFVYACI